MPNTNKPLPMDAIMADFEQAGFSKHSILAMRQWFSGIDVSLTPIGEIKSQVPIKGRTEGIGTTAQNLTTTGQVNALSNVLDDAIYIKSPQFAGALNMAENGNFEAAATLPPPGWTALGATVLSYETVLPQEGLRSLVVTTTQQFGGAIANRKYLARPGDVFKISGSIFQANIAQAGTVVISFLDKNGVQIGTVDTGPANGGSGAWTSVFATGVAPANTSSVQLKLQSEAVNGGTAKFDSIVCTRLATAFELTPINTAGTPRATTGLLTQHSAGSTQIDAASSQWQFGDGQVAYNTGSADPGVLQTSYVTGDDPGYGGGGIPYIPRTTPADANAANGRLFFGKIITAAGTATSVGGGSGGGGPISKAALA